MKIHIAGFYGHGNAGDEAMLAGLLNHVLPDHQVAIMTAAAAQLRERIPQRVIDINNRRAAEECDTLLIGGGDLGTGFAWNLIPYALHAGRRVALIGQTIPHQWFGNGYARAANLAKAVLQNVHYVASRDWAGTDRLRQIGGFPIHQGADPAFLLDPVQVTREPNLAVVFVRHTTEIRLEENIQLAIQVINWLRKDNARVVLGACANDDQRMLTTRFPNEVVKRISFDVKQSLALCGRASLVVSIGRLHPMILATIQGTRSVVVPLPDGNPPEKIAGMAEVLGIPVASRDPVDLLNLVQQEWNATECLPDLIRREQREMAQRMMREAIEETPSAQF